ncbi:Tungsten-containing aldehyde ferredoxin oxidored uctase cofactor modifying protein [Candidatus Magnetomoraceae bacterium gMMP-15]
MTSHAIIPKHLQIETINGVCTARCRMCTINKWTRKPNRMKKEKFEVILGKFVPYIQHLDYLTLHGCGEPLLDRGLPKKISLAKHLGFRGTGFATNCTELNPNTSTDLIESGLDTIICSIDGIKKETHEAIRIGTIFEEVVENVKAFIELRDTMSGTTRVLIRFIRQNLNYEEWPMFYDKWTTYLSHEKGDDVIMFDEHNWGKEETSVNTEHSPLICSDIFERFLVYSDGRVGFCCADDNGFFDLGNVIKDDPLEIYNCEQFWKYRKYMQDGRIGELEHCKGCTIPQLREKKTNPKTMKTG